MRGGGKDRLAFYSRAHPQKHTPPMWRLWKGWGIEQGFDWSAFEALLSRLGDGRAPGYPPLTMFKIVLLQQWYTLSDPAAEEAVRDRLSFRLFGCLPLDIETPDHPSIWRVRQTIDKLGLSAALLAEVNRQLDARGLVIKRGTLVDATLIAGAVRRL